MSLCLVGSQTGTDCSRLVLLLFFFFPRHPSLVFLSLFLHLLLDYFVNRKPKVTELHLEGKFPNTAALLFSQTERGKENRKKKCDDKLLCFSLNSGLTHWKEKCGGKRTRTHTEHSTVLMPSSCASLYFNTSLLKY